jgi:threonine dehydratase
MHGLFTRGTQAGLEDLPSLADGLAGALEDGSITMPLVRQVVNQMYLVTEEEIAQAIVYAWRQHGQVIEGSGAVSLAAALYHAGIPRPAVLIVSGGNIQPETHAALLEKYPGTGREAH